MTSTIAIAARDDQSSCPALIAPLPAALSQFAFDKENAPYPFSKRLAEENDLDHGFALRVVEEYRKFIRLLATVSNDLVPSPLVETAWRLHLIYTRSYWIEMCQRVLGKRIWHRCDDGSEAPEKLLARYARTVKAYREVFGVSPPEDIWTAPEPKGSGYVSRLIKSRALAKQTAAAKSLLRPTVENIPPEHMQKWRRLNNFEFDKPGAVFPFTRRLAHENEWNLPFTMLVMREYIRFRYLMATVGHMVTPALVVDEAWHLHCGETVSYWDEMGKGILGERFHHAPGDGSVEDDIKYNAIYQRTLWEYELVFGPPPFEIWGRPNTSIHWPVILKELGV